MVAALDLCILRPGASFVKLAQIERPRIRRYSSDHSMNISLIMPGVGRKPGERYVNSWNMQPLGLASLAAVTPPDVGIRFVDDRCESISYDEPTDAVGINVETYSARRAYAIAAQFRRRGIPVIMGGFHPTLMPEEVARYGDAIVEGQAETLWPRIILDLKEGRLQPRYQADNGPLPPGIHPRRDLFAGRKYQPITLIETGRGCRFACDFCSVSQFTRQTVWSRPIEDVLEEVQAAAHRDIFFIDDNIVVDRERAKRLFAALRPMGIRWVSQGSIDMAGDPELLSLMAQSGCRGILVGFESLSTATLAAMGKSWNRAVRDYEEAIKRLRDAGIAIYATFVFGYDTDGADALDKTVEFAIRQRFFMAAFNHLVPFPGTPLYRRLKQAGRLRVDPWWLDPCFRFGDVPFHPKNMSAEELAQRCYQARSDFYRFSSILTRACDLRSNCNGLRSAATYLGVNLFSGRETRKRQGLPLGEGFDDASFELQPESVQSDQLVGVGS